MNTHYSTEFRGYCYRTHIEGIRIGSEVDVVSVAISTHTVITARVQLSIDICRHKRWNSLVHKWAKTNLKVWGDIGNSIGYMETMYMYTLLKTGSNFGNFRFFFLVLILAIRTKFNT